MAEPPQMTPKQRELWESFFQAPIAGTDGATQEEAESFAIAEFRYICWCEEGHRSKGIGVPDEDAIRIAFRALVPSDEPPHMTPAQQYNFHLMFPKPLEATSGQTLQQRENFAVASFHHWCRLDGLGRPDEEDVRRALRQLG